MTTPTELWRPVKNYEHFEVSNLGNVRRQGETAYLKPEGRGYRYVTLRWRRSRHAFVRPRIDQLVAHAWVEGYKRGCKVAHLNGDKRDDRSVNLEWR